MAKENGKNEDAPEETPKPSRWATPAKIATGCAIGIAVGVGISFALATGEDVAAATEEAVRFVAG